MARRFLSWDLNQGCWSQGPLPSVCVAHVWRERFLWGQASLARGVRLKPLTARTLCGMARGLWLSQDHLSWGPAEHSWPHRGAWCPGLSAQPRISSLPASSVPACVTDQPAQDLAPSLWKTTSATVTISPLRMNLISGSSHTSARSDEWVVTKLGDTTIGHKWGATFKQFEPFSCQDCELLWRHFPKTGSKQI